MIKIKKKSLYEALLFFAVSFVLNANEREQSELKIRELKHEKKVTLEEAQDASQREMIAENPLEKELIEALDKGIERLSRLAEKLPKDSEARSKILNKLVEMALEKASYVTTREHRVFNKTWNQWYKNGKKGPEPKFDEEPQKNNYKEVIKKADKFLKEYPESESRVLVYFQKAVAFQYLDQYQRAIDSFQNIIDEYPNHPLASEAFFEVGSYYFDRDSFRFARINFDSVLKFKDASRVDWTYYKLGWIEFNQGYFKECLEYWKKAVVLTEKKEKETGKKNLLKKQVLKDMIFVFSELGQVEEALAYYEKHGNEENISKFLFYLAQTYFEQGRVSKAEGTYKKILTLFPNEKEAVKAVSELCLIAYETREYKKLWSYLESWFKDYGEESEWGQANPDFWEENRENTRDSILYYAQKMHEEVQGNKVIVDKIIHSKSFLLKNARYGYKLYLKLYPDSKRLAEILEYLADVNYLLSDYKEAARVYTKIVKLPKEEAVIRFDSNKAPKNIHERSAVNMLSAVSRYFLPYYEKLLKEIPDFSKPPKNLSAEAKDFMSSCTLYLKSYPKDEAVKKKCYLFSSELFYRNAYKLKARKYLAAIAVKYRNSQEGPVAADKLMSLYEEKPETQVKLAKKLLTYPEYENSELGVTLRQLIRTMALKRIVQEENELQRGKLYEQYALKNKTDPDVDLIWFNAAIAYLAVGQRDSAIRCFLILVKKYPKFSKNKDVLLQLANLYENGLELGKALFYYSQFSKKYPRDAAIKGVLQKSCILSFVERKSSFFDSCLVFSRAYTEDAKSLVESFLKFSLYEENFKLYGKILTELYFKSFSLTENEKFLASYSYYKGTLEASNKTSFRKKILSLSSYKKLSGKALKLYAGIHADAFSEKISLLKLSSLNVNVAAVFQKNLQTNFALLKDAEAEASKILAFKEAASTMKAYGVLAFLYKEVHLSLKKTPPISGVTKESLDRDLKPTRDLIAGQFKNYLANAEKVASDYQVKDPLVFRIKRELASMSAPEGLLFEEWLPPLYLLTVQVEQKFSHRIPYRSE